MPFPFSLLCNLLNKLDRDRAKKALKTSKALSVNTQAVASWFSKNDQIIPREGPEAVAFLSCLFPERRPDRVFNLQEKSLESIIKRAQGLGATRFKALRNWRTKDSTDFASCVERVMSATDSEPRPCPSVTLEEIDETLDRIAATSPFSSIDLREMVAAKYAKPIRTHDALSVIFRRLNSSEAKWMVRMLLKSYSPVQVPEILAMRQFHFLLSDLLSFQKSFEAAVKLLSGPIVSRMPAHATKDVESLLRQIAVRRHANNKSIILINTDLNQ